MSKRRDHGEGSIFQRERDGKWVARLELGYVNGKRKRVERLADTKSLARQKLTELKKAQEQGVKPQSLKQTFGDFMTIWLETVKANRAYLTYERRERYWRNHIQPALGRHVLSGLTPVVIQSFLNRTTNEKTVCVSRECADLLSVALGAAVRMRLIPVNPVKMIERPRYKPQERPVFSMEQTSLFLSALEAEPHRALYIVAIGLGLRRGELLGLRWCDVDFEEDTLHVRSSIQWCENGRELGPPKTESSKRSIPLPATVIKALRRHRAEQLQVRLLAREEWKDTDAVFANPKGSPLSATVANQTLTRILKKAGLPHLRLHDLRHCCATFLLAQGCQPRQVQEILGHSDIKITLSVYGHILTERKRDTADRMESFLTGSG